MHRERASCTGGPHVPGLAAGGGREEHVPGVRRAAAPAGELSAARVPGRCRCSEALPSAPFPAAGGGQRPAHLPPALFFLR